MLELTVGITIFALAMLPLIWLSTSQTKGAYSVGKHMMAGQIATSFLDKMLKLPFDKCYEEVKSNTGRKKVLRNPEIEQMIQDMNDESITNDMEASFRNFEYKFEYDDSCIDEKILRVNIEVFYRVVKTEQSVKLSALKHGDKNG